MRIIRKPIFQRPSGIWWGYSALKADRIYSLRTRDKAKAQERYDEHLANMRMYVTEAAHDPAGNAGMQGVQERYRT